MPVKEYGRRPYVTDDKPSQVEAMKRVTDKAIFDQREEAQSEMKKPYMHDDYGEMEYWREPPVWRPYWPDMPFLGTWGGGTTSGSTAWGPDPAPNLDESPQWGPGGAYVVGCEIAYIYGKTTGPLLVGDKVEDCTEEFCLSFDGGALGLSGYVRQPIKSARITKGSGKITKLDPETHEVCFEISGGEAASTSPLLGQLFEITVYLEPPAPGVPAGSCKAIAYVNCCTDADPLSYDEDNSPETIAQDSFATVYVLDGCPPFTWDVVCENTGDFVFPTKSTSGRSNTIATSADACGSGFITVTDSLGDSAVGSIRSTAGSSWQLCGAGWTTGGPPGATCGNVNFTIFEGGFLVQGFNCNDRGVGQSSSTITFLGVSYTFTASDFSTACGGGAGCKFTEDGGEYCWKCL